MTITPGAIDISALSDEDALQFAAAPSETPPALPVSAPAQLPGAIDLGQLSDAQAAQFVGPEGLSGGVSMAESFGRGALSGATFDFDDDIGLSDKAAKAAAKKANPWTHFAGEVVGSLAPMAAAAPLAAVRGTGLLARGARGVGSALNPARTETLGQAALQGAKVGVTYGALSGAGHADIKDADSFADAAVKRLVGAGLGAGAGAVLGPAAGALGHGASKLIGAGMNRLSPELQDIVAAASAPETQGVRDLARYARYDGYTTDDFARLRTAMNDPAQAHRYEGLNLLEALEVQGMRAMPHTGELKPGVKVSPNLSDAAQDAANTQGEGRQLAREAWATRNQEMGAKVTADVDQMFGDRTGAAVANQFGRTIPSKADDIAALPRMIDDAFGSGAAAENNIAAIAARADKLNARYDRMRKQPDIFTNELGEMAKRSPVMAKAIKDAAEVDDIARALKADGPLPVGAGSMGDWVKGLATAEGQVLQHLKPSNILDIHHQLVLAAKPTAASDPAAVMKATQLKNWFSNWVDRQYKGHKDLRSEYTAFKASMEGAELAEKLPLVGGALKPEALTFLENAERKYMQAAQVAERRSRAWEANRLRIERGDINPRTGAPYKTPLEQARRDTERAIDLASAWREVIDGFRATWGEKLKQEIAGAKAPEKLLDKALTQAGRERIVRVLGERNGNAFVENLLTVEARRQGMALSLKAGGADHAALQFYEKAVREGRTDAVEAFRQAWGERIKQELAAAGTPAQVAQVVRSLLTKEGKDRIHRILGPEEGRMFVEMLYNKEQQLGLGQRLYGGPDTAYKLARQKKTEALSNAVAALKPWAPQPMEFLRSLGQLTSARYTQQRADAMNRLLSQQGPESVTAAIDAIIARSQLAQTGAPYVLRPGLRVTGPATGAAVGNMEDARNAPRPPMLLPYKP